MLLKKSQYFHQTVNIDSVAQYIRNLDDVVIKKPVQKSSSWNVVNVTSLAEKETVKEEERKATNVANTACNKLDEKEEGSDSLGGKFCLFPVSTDSDPISALRNNWRASTSYLSEDNQFNNEEESKPVELSDDKISKTSPKETAKNNHKADIETKMSTHLQNNSILDRKQSFCLEATLKHLDLEAAILPSI